MAVSRAGTPAEQTASAAISGETFSRASGVLTINQAAGNGNAQANVTVIGKSAAPVVHQSTTAAGVVNGRAEIGAFAFSGVTGIVQLNQSAGNGNTQQNVVIVTDSTLAAALAPHQSVAPSDSSGSSADAVTVDKTAFGNAKGIVQVSQIAGSSNRTANTFVLQIQGAAGH